MTSRQHPLHSGFDAASTASDVLAGLDLHGKTAIVTGGHSGLGLETTRALAQAGAHVVVGARSVAAAREATYGIAGVEIAALELADPTSVAAFAARFVDAGRRVHIIINSAGIMACPETRLDDGREAQLAVNHLGHYALVNRLWPVLAHGDGARVVAVSSLGHRLSPIRWDDIDFAGGYDKWLAYGQSKTANALFAVRLDMLGAPFGVRAYSLHPGKIATPLQRHLTREEMMAQGWVDEHGVPIDPTFKTPAQGAATQVWAATSPRLADLGGVYCEDCDVAAVTRGNEEAGVRTHAIDPEAAARLWAWSAAATGVDAFAGRG
ncbi:MULTISPECIES: SDR family NAD(P)-dependent oxidoreductase [Burkholderia cepacia complex]|jgi:NAD(P)-dependent dehydrogenase (short-subunit alcohol dehydrogenase family)|uniref:Probable oxidoreductase n=1 Tax=Burkholderia orbicola (strain MC0-3) TaxID=406425 RepID=B1KAQ7_BURO0|nr:MULTISPECIES: SDR family NAD(P)-dependent oxidoreductase [Burkholderia cepacia complex]ACA95304.1 short-chain dehydrogenase/reductase SDR [Burkholderia orbicola MC0-3]MCA8088490.1 SDR family NAD(P)-dependent oxidoreductase [Burkholderia cenocepacia]HEB3528662.1 SDR family NAD(P)-dependent oxidoreductase [Burkholderia cenocepacia]